MPNQPHTLTLSLPADLNEDQVGRFAEDFAESFVDGMLYATSLIRLHDPFLGPWQIQWLLADKPDQTDVTARLGVISMLHNLGLPEITIEPTPDINWLEYSYRQFPPFAVGHFYIHGSHTTDPIPADMINLQIDAATAFGSGDHGTTSGCLLLLEQLKNNRFVPKNVLDMGCGSGILSIGACKLWSCPVTAVDIDPESIRVTQNHQAANGIGTQLQSMAGDGFNVVSSSYDLIIANILPQPLKDMAKALVNHLNPGGYVILSGMLLDQVDGVMPFYTEQNLAIQTRLERGEWGVVLLKKIG